MKRRKIAWMLILLLCAMALLSGALLILYADHECRQVTCPVCIILARNTESFLSLLIASASIGLLGGLDKYCVYMSPENRFIPDWTLVRRKVKLQD